MTDNIEQLLNQDDINSALQEITEDMKDWDNFGTIAIAWTSKDIIKHRFFGTNAEVIGLLEIGKQIHMDRILYGDSE